MPLLDRLQDAADAWRRALGLWRAADADPERPAAGLGVPSD